LLAALDFKPPLTVSRTWTHVTLASEMLSRTGMFGNPGNDASPLQLSSLHHNPFCDGCARDAEQKENAEIEFDQQNVAKERLGPIYRLPFDEVRK